MVNDSSGKDLHEECYRMAHSENWEMISLKEEGVPLKHEFFIVNVDQSPETNQIEERVQSINRKKLMGSGYQIDFYEHPSPGCKVVVREGWALQGEVQSSLWLQRFLELIGAH